MSRLVDAGTADELADGTMKALKIDGRDILLARVGGVYYAADERCPHMGGRLSRGTLEGTIVICPRHGSRFDLSDGRNDRWTRWTGMTLKIAKALKSPRPLKTYPVRRQEDRVLVELD